MRLVFIYINANEKSLKTLPNRALPFGSTFPAFKNSKPALKRMPLSYPAKKHEKQSVNIKIRSEVCKAS